MKFSKNMAEYKENKEKSENFELGSFINKKKKKRKEQKKKREIYLSWNDET